MTHPNKAAPQEPRASTLFSQAVHDPLPYLNEASPQERLRWGLERYGDDVFLSTSFGAQSAVLLHMVTQIKPDIPVIFIDTQHLHAETYRYKRDLTNLLGLNVKTYRAEMSAAEQVALFGERWEHGEEALEAYHVQNKVEPMERAVRESGARLWLSGIRRGQSEFRAEKPVFETQGKIQKLYPMIDWTSQDVYNYRKEHNLPAHPLWEKGYSTIGDFFEDPFTRSECGLHDRSVGKRDQSVSGWDPVI